MDTQPPDAPRATKIPHEHVAHGNRRRDPYYWLRERENPDVIAYLGAENRYLRRVMAPVAPLKEKLFAEIVARIKKDDGTPPYLFRGHYYYARTEGEGEYSIRCRRAGSMDAPEEVLLDENRLAEGHDYFDLWTLAVSPDEHLLAFSVDTVGRFQYTLRVKSLATGELLLDSLPGTSGALAWAADGKTLFYVENDPETLRACRVMRHTLGTLATADVEVYREDDTAFSCAVFPSKSQAFIMLAIISTLTTETRFLDARDPQGELRVVQPRQVGIEYSAAHCGDHFYIRTNLRAPNFRIMRAPLDQPGLEHWEEILPHRPDVLVESIEVFRDHLVICEREAGLSYFRVRRHDGTDDHRITFPEPVYTAYFSVNREFDSRSLRFAYTSMVTPHAIFDYDMETRARTCLKQDEVVGGHEVADFISERLMAPAPDGERVPISLVYRRDAPRDGTRPLLMYGYGAYGCSYDPEFDSASLSLLNRGFAIAIAHVRGGEELGRRWYDAGRLLNKRNTFTDFIACAEALIARGYAAPGKLYASGGSAGGLLMGAVCNLRPDLFAGIQAEVPFVDVVTTMQDDTIPLTSAEYDEWGDPSNKQHYDSMLSYSPYDNVEPKSYPPLLVTTGPHDSQVQYWEPAKWVAKLRDLKTDDNPLLLHTEMEAGHGGLTGRFARFSEVALGYAFFLWLEGIGE